MGYSDRVERKFLRKARKFSHPFLQWEHELQEIAKRNCLQATVEGHLFTKQGNVLTPLQFAQHRGQG